MHTHEQDAARIDGLITRGCSASTRFIRAQDTAKRTKPIVQGRQNHPEPEAHSKSICVARFDPAGVMVFWPMLDGCLTYGIQIVFTIASDALLILAFHAVAPQHGARI